MRGFLFFRRGLDILHHNDYTNTMMKSKVWMYNCQQCRLPFIKFESNQRYCPPCRLQRDRETNKRKCKKYYQKRKAWKQEARATEIIFTA